MQPLGSRHMLDHMQKIVGRDTACKMFVDMYE